MPQSIAPSAAPAVVHQPGRILVVDDEAPNRLTLAMLLRSQGHEVTAAANGEEALDLLRQRDFDLVLLDIQMPVMDGYTVLARMHADERMRHVPVVVCSANEQIDSVVRCIQLGAADYITKPVHVTLVTARVDACLERKQLHDREQQHLAQIEAEHDRAEALLLNVLPAPVADRLKRHENIADSFDDVTVLFADLAGFTHMAAEIGPRELVAFLNEVFSAFDALAARRNLEKIKTIGDAYMVVGGVPLPRQDHCEAVAELAIDIQTEVARHRTPRGEPLQMRVGIHVGPVVAGVIGASKFAYDLWGDVVNTASRMESTGVPGRIQVTREVRDRLATRFTFEPRGRVEVKGKGPMEAWLLVGHVS